MGLTIQFCSSQTAIRCYGGPMDGGIACYGDLDNRGFVQHGIVAENKPKWETEFGRTGRDMFWRWCRDGDSPQHRVCYQLRYVYGRDVLVFQCYAPNEGRDGEPRPR